MRTSGRRGRPWRRRSFLAAVVLIVSAAGAVAVRAFENDKADLLPPPTGPLSVLTEEVSVEGPDGRLLHLSLWRPADAQKPAPLVIYSPALGGRRDDNTALVRDLASHGYIVAAVDDARHSAMVGQAAAVTFDYGTPASIDKMRREGAHHVSLQSAYIRAALDGLSRDKRLAAAFDPSRIGVLGYSIGGASAVDAGLYDQRLSAIINIDGWLFGDTLSGENLPVGTSYMCIQSDEAFPPAEDARSIDPSTRANLTLSRADQDRQVALAMGRAGYWVRVDGSFHGDFSDGIYRPSKRDEAERLGIASATREAVLNFLNETLAKTPDLAPVSGQDRLRWMIVNGKPPVRAASAPTQPSAASN